MTFGELKTVVEKNLVESYLDENIFKKTIKEFKKNILNDKSFSIMYTLYDQLSTPQGLTESDAKDFLNEAIVLIQEIIQKNKFPKFISESKINQYEDIDNLVYNKTFNIIERLESRKNIIKTLMMETKQIKEPINIPIKTTIKIAKQTISNYFNNLDENTKKEFLQLISEDSEKLKQKFEEIRVSALDKLHNILESQEEHEIKEKILGTIDRIKSENFDHLNFLKLKNLEESI